VLTAPSANLGFCLRPSTKQKYILIYIYKLKYIIHKV